MESFQRSFIETKTWVYRVSTEIGRGEWVQDPEVLTELERLFEEAERDFCYTGQKRTKLTRQGNVLTIERPSPRLPEKKPVASRSKTGLRRWRVPNGF